jgi:uncharacterized membrane protein
VRTLDEQICHAPADVAFQVAADVEDWPRILSHYRWVRFQRKDSFAQGLVEMAAWRHFAALGYPTWWVSEMEYDAPSLTVRYRHVQGVTTGMDVVWQVRPLPDGTSSHLSIIHEWDGPTWPVIGRFAADHVIGPGFVSHIAGLTLKGVATEAERRSA